MRVLLPLTRVIALLYRWPPGVLSQLTNVFCETYREGMTGWGGGGPPPSAYNRPMDRIYLDANATTPVLPEVVEAMRPFWSETFGNPSSAHHAGQRARSAIDHARTSIARLLVCSAKEIVFTSGGTESDNLALDGVLSTFL